MSSLFAKDVQETCILLSSVIFFSNFFQKDRKQSRSSHLEVFYEKGVLENFAKFREKHLHNLELVAYLQRFTWKK